MKDSEFIELLNLYLDHEISAADAAKLEAEVQTNPARRRVYQQYCRMQKACKLVASDFQSETEEVAVPSDRKVVAFDPTAISAAALQRKRAGRLYTLGTFAAVAACMAIVVVGRSRQQATHDNVAVTPAVVSQPIVAAPASPNADAAVPHGLVSLAQRPQATLVANPLLLTGNTRAEAVFAAAIEQANHQLAWIDSVKLTPLQVRSAADDLRFDTPPSSLRPEGRALGGRRAVTGEPSEMSAFRIAK